MVEEAGRALLLLREDVGEGPVDLRAVLAAVGLVAGARLCRSTAVPSIARIGGATLSFTPSERQPDATPESVSSSRSWSATITRSTPASPTSACHSSRVTRAGSPFGRRPPSDSLSSPTWPTSSR